jgi:hypothetical protein
MPSAVFFSADTNSRRFLLSNRAGDCGRTNASGRTGVVFLNACQSSNPHMSTMKHRPRCVSWSNAPDIRGMPGCIPVIAAGLLLHQSPKTQVMQTI